MRAYHRQDYYLAVTTFLLVIFGLIMVASASVVQSYEVAGTNNFYLFRQGGFAIVGLILWWILQKVDYHVWKRFATIALVVGLILLGAVLVPGLGVEAGGARRWIGLGDMGTLQASEIMKFALIVYLAYWFEKKGRRVADFYSTFLPFIMIVGVVALLVIQEPDFGTAVLIALIAGTMYMAAGATWGQLGTLFTAGAALITFLVYSAPYRVRRILIFLNPGADPLGAGYHVNQALLAIGSGGLFGLGYGHSRQKFNFLPEAASDSIFAIIGEELGLIGAVFFVLLPFAIIVWRGLEIARRAPDMFGRIMALGLTVWIGYQALINIGATIGLFPLTGMPLPFVSLGGSSLVIMLMACGVLLNISKQTVKTSKDENPLSGWWDWWSHLVNSGSRRRSSK
ncbi:putative lipid II flippase FtsW [candidate division Kazan bacterium]|uniref:Probable peptidoglycan glycosyltransferase FtsW n=1 Tax=candidate division Kazan bacterium TaxID=2202143 RepID=A0A420ZD08_UNCK3|nr:MAG: putative lipid II flippase FtsW [candidate division Kazan bacterium]